MVVEFRCSSPPAGVTSREMFPSFELYGRTRSCGELESRTASEMTDLESRD